VIDPYMLAREQSTTIYLRVKKNNPTVYYIHLEKLTIQGTASLYKTPYLICSYTTYDVDVHHDTLPELVYIYKLQSSG
jgi:hypothetical protein